MRTRGRLLLGLVLAVGLVVAGTVVAVAQQPEPEPVPVRPAVVVADAPFSMHGTGDAAELVPVHHFRAGQPIGPQLDIFEVPGAPGGTVPDSVMLNPTHEGFPLVVSVVEESDDGSWLRVRLPRRPNGSTGWVRASDLVLWEVPNRIAVSVGTRILQVFDGDSDTVLFQTDVAVGRGSTPTPLGDFHIDIVNPLGGHRVYGWGQLSLSGFSDVLQSFGGGIGQIALHGWNDDDVIGTPVSNGCVRMRNADIERVAELAPLGTPVAIVA